LEWQQKSITMKQRIINKNFFSLTIKT